MKSVKQPTLGLVNLIGALACGTIAAELHEDLTRNTHNFRLPRPVKVVALFGFCLFLFEEVNKVRRRVDNLFT